MLWLDLDTDNCSIHRTLEVIGEKWTILVLRECFNGVRRFDQIRDHVGVSESILSDRLRTLVSAGVLDRSPYREAGSRTRFDYRLTEKGSDLYPVLIALLNWGDRYYAEPEGPAITVTHKGCGEHVRTVVECQAHHRLEHHRQARALPGGGARLRESR